MNTSGLKNLGNTCYLNTCIQILSHTPNINTMLGAKEHNKHSQKCIDLLHNIRIIIKSLWEQPLCVNPINMIKNMQTYIFEKNNNFNVLSQNDLTEILLAIVDAFHEVTKSKQKISSSGTIKNEQDKMAVICYNYIKETYDKGYSPVINLFYGIQITKIENMAGEILSIKPESFFMLDLPLTDNTLEGCINNYYASEKLYGDNQYLNEKTNKKEDVYKKLSVWSFSDILVISLKRFKNHNKLFKDNTIISFNINNLDLSNYVEGYNSDSYQYELYAVGNHMGNINNGHYNAYIKNYSDNEWYLYNDNNIIKINSEKIEDLLKINAYCLFYKKKNM